MSAGSSSQCSHSSPSSSPRSSTQPASRLAAIVDAGLSRCASTAMNPSVRHEHCSLSGSGTCSVEHASRSQPDVTETAAPHRSSTSHRAPK